MSEENTSTDVDYYGFLTKKQRRYLLGEFDLADHSNPSVFKKRLRERIEGANRDYALLEDSEHVSNEELSRALRVEGNDGPLDFMTNEAREEAKNAGLGHATAMMGDGAKPLYNVMETAASEQLRERRQNQEIIMAMVLRTLKEVADYNDREAMRWVRANFPTRHEALELISE